VGIVAGLASVLLDDGVHRPFIHHLVALGTKSRFRLDEKRLVLRSVGTVAVHTPSVHRGLVDNSLASRGIIVTLQTKGRRILDEECLVLRAVGVVADQATVLFDDGMQIALLSRVVVAFGTKFRTGFDQEGRVLRGVRVVAVNTPSVCRSFMDHSCP
jgi:hypothetical protein